MMQAIADYRDEIEQLQEAERGLNKKLQAEIIEKDNLSLEFHKMLNEEKKERIKVQDDATQAKLIAN